VLFDRSGRQTGDAFLFSCSDTDSIYITTRHKNLRDNERQDLPEEERERLRKELFGSEDTYNFGRVKVENEADSITILGPKCYFLMDGERDVRQVKFKGSSTAAGLDAGTLNELGDRKAMLRERSVVMDRSPFGVRDRLAWNAIRCELPFAFRPGCP